MTHVSIDWKDERVKEKIVGIWIRVSTEDQASGESPATHEHRARSYAEAKGWQVETVYDLSAVSGKTIIHHPETQAMMADVESGRITGLIFSKLARLARNTKELLEIAEWFQQHGADLISLHESIDTSTTRRPFLLHLACGDGPMGARRDYRADYCGPACSGQDGQEHWWPRTLRVSVAGQRDGRPSRGSTRTQTDVRIVS